MSMNVLQASMRLSRAAWIFQVEWLMSLTKTNLYRAGSSDQLAETVNYEILYRVVAEEMQAPARLLEHLAHRIIDRILHQFGHVRWVEVSVSKFNPPVGGICQRARVTLKRKRPQPVM